VVGLAGLDVNRLSMEAWTLCFGEKLYAWNIIAVSRFSHMHDIDVNTVLGVK